jgi:hypothetical protein
MEIIPIGEADQVCATMALNAGFTAPIVMALGGWRSEQMMRRYAPVTDETLRRAAEAVARNGHHTVTNGSTPHTTTPSKASLGTTGAGG